MNSSTTLLARIIVTNSSTVEKHQAEELSENPNYFNILLKREFSDFSKAFLFCLKLFNLVLGMLYDGDFNAV